MWTASGNRAEDRPGDRPTRASRSFVQPGTVPPTGGIARLSASAMRRVGFLYAGRLGEGGDGGLGEKGLKGPKGPKGRMGLIGPIGPMSSQEPKGLWIAGRRETPESLAGCADTAGCGLGSGAWRRGLGLGESRFRTGLSSPEMQFRVDFVLPFCGVLSRVNIAGQTVPVGVGQLTGRLKQAGYRVLTPQTIQKTEVAVHGFEGG